MNKEDAKKVLSDVYDEILRHMEEQGEEVDEALLIDFLHFVASELLNNNFKRPFDFFSHRHAFEEEYKQLAEQSVDSYSQSNKKFAALDLEQQKALDRFDESLIDTSGITQCFKEMQSHLHKEVNLANDTINDLIDKVKELENQSSIDPLTKVYNRGALEKYLFQACSIENFVVHMHLFMLDVDDFKTINDTHGHLVGDKVLIYLANQLKNTLREGDKIFRYGGEEFIIVLNRTDDDGYKFVAERILKLVRTSKLRFKDEDISCKLSIGITQLKAGDTMETLIGRADKALYHAKESGKDKYKVEV